MSNGPICHIPPDNTPANPQPINLPGMPGPVSVNPHNINQTLNDFANLLNALRMLLLLLSGQRRSGGNNGGPGGGGGGQNGRPGDKNSKLGRWTEEDRVTSTVRVFQNNDKTSKNWVDVEQINQLRMRDTVTGEGWVWTR